MRYDIGLLMSSLHLWDFGKSYLSKHWDHFSEACSDCGILPACALA